jgi:hypothetical protein
VQLLPQNLRRLAKFGIKLKENGYWFLLLQKMVHTFGKMTDGCYPLIFLHLENIGSLDIMDQVDAGFQAIGSNFILKSTFRND